MNCIVDGVNFRYLEDVIPLINYRPPAVKTINRGNEDAKQADRDGYRSKGLDEQSIHAIESIGRSDRIDSQVSDAFACISSFLIVLS